MPISPTSSENSRGVAARRFLPALLAAGLFAGAFFATSAAEAQKKKSTKPPSHAAGGAAAGHGGGAGPAMQGAPGIGNNANIQKKIAKERDSKTVEPVDLEKLPPGYRVPQEPPEPYTTTDEWRVHPFGKRRESSALADYNQILASGLFTGEDQRKFVADVVRWKLARLTQKEFREQAYTKRVEILRDISRYPSPQNKSNRDVRRFILKTIAEEAPRLFKYHAVARINGAILLAELSDPAYNEVDGDNRKPAEPCVRALEPLLALVDDKKEIVGARVWGVNGLVRLAALPELKQVPRTEIIEKLVTLLYDSADEHEWYQFRLVEGLGKLNVVLNGAKTRPFVATALARVLANTKRTWLVRSEAALSLGRLSYPIEIDAGLVAYETALLAQQIAESDDYRNDPKLALWKLCSLKLYGAFKPIDLDQQRALLMQTEKGPLASYRRTVQEAFDVVLPVIRKVVAEQEEMDTALANLRKWLDANVPKNFKIHPDDDSIIADGPIVNKPNNAAGHGAAELPAAANGNGGR
jgi:hypothetical protein